MHNRVHNRTTEARGRGRSSTANLSNMGTSGTPKQGRLLERVSLISIRQSPHFFWDPTQPNTYVTIEVPGEIGTSPTAINDSGQIAGVYLESTTRKRKGFLRGADGTFTLFEIGTSTNLQVLALNDRGTIVGMSFKLGITTG
jgi:hypothetical protein